MALIKRHSLFYLSDSYSRDDQGLSIVDGTSVFVKVFRC